MDSTYRPTRLRGPGWRPCVWLCKGQCCTHGHKTYNQRCIDYMYGLMTVDERLGHVGISTHTAGKSDLPRNLIVSPICSCHFCSVHCVTNAQRQCHQYRAHGSCIMHMPPAHNIVLNSLSPHSRINHTMEKASPRPALCWRTPLALDKVKENIYFFYLCKFVQIFHIIFQLFC